MPDEVQRRVHSDPKDWRPATLSPRVWPARWPCALPDLLRRHRPQRMLVDEASCARDRERRGSLSLAHLSADQQVKPDATFWSFQSDDSREGPVRSAPLPRNASSWKWESLWGGAGDAACGGLRVPLRDMRRSDCKKNIRDLTENSCALIEVRQPWDQIAEQSARRCLAGESAGSCQHMEVEVCKIRPQQCLEGDEEESKDAKVAAERI